MNIALIAHDSKKELMVQFCTAYSRTLSQHKLVATGTTGKMVAEATGLPVQLSSNTLVVLTNAPVRIAVTSPDLKPGLLADVTLTFTKGGPVKLVAPVVSASEPEYESITVG